MRAARAHGIPMSTWNSWTVEDRAWALGLDALEASRCPVCGGDPKECQDRANQFAYEFDGTFCYRTRAQLEFMDAKTKDNQKARIIAGSSVVRTRLNPAKRRVR